MSGCGGAAAPPLEVAFCALFLREPANAPLRLNFKQTWQDKKIVVRFWEFNKKRFVKANWSLVSRSHAAAAHNPQCIISLCFYNVRMPFPTFIRSNLSCCYSERERNFNRKIVLKSGSKQTRRKRSDNGVSLLHMYNITPSTPSNTRPYLCPRASSVIRCDSGISAASPCATKG